MKTDAQMQPWISHFIYSGVPNRRACSLRFFRFSFHPARNFHVINEKFPPARLLIYLVNKQAGWHFFPSLLVYSGLLFYQGLQSTLHRGVFCLFPFQWIYSYGSNKSTGKETSKMHLFTLSEDRPDRGQQNITIQGPLNTVVQVTIRVGTLGYDLGPAICDTCQKASQGSYIVSQKGILVGICGLATIVNFTPKKHKIGKIW